MRLVGTGGRTGFEVFSPARSASGKASNSSTDGSVEATMPEHAEQMDPSRRNQDDPSAIAGADDGRILLVGARRRVRGLARCLDQPRWSGLRIVGFVDVSGRGRQLAVHPRSDPVPILGRIDRLAELIDRSKATHLLVALSSRRARRLAPIIESMSAGSIRVHWVTEEAARPHSFGARPLAPRISWELRWGRFAKRIVDILGASLGLLALFPVLFLAALAVLITSGRPIFYTQERVGQGGRLFRIWKFRSMRNDAEGRTGPIWAVDHDERCTRIGAWLRHTNIDELPQLFNVLRGDMSLVGPRPERPMFVERFRAEIADYDLRHAVPAGMTGWAQVHGYRGRTSLRKRVQYDLDYIRRWTFWLDFRILLMTVQHVIWSKTTWNEPWHRLRLPKGWRRSL